MEMEKGCYNKFNNYTHASFLSSTARVRLIAKTRIAIPGVARRQVARRRGERPRAGAWRSRHAPARGTRIAFSRVSVVVLRTLFVEQLHSRDESPPSPPPVINIQYCTYPPLSLSPSLFISALLSPKRQSPNK